MEINILWYRGYVNCSELKWELEVTEACSCSYSPGFRGCKKCYVWYFIAFSQNLWVKLLSRNCSTRNGQSLYPGVYGSIGSAALQWENLFSSADIEVPSTHTSIRFGVIVKEQLIFSKSEALAALTWQGAASFRVPQERIRNIQSVINDIHIVIISYNLIRKVFFIICIYIVTCVGGTRH
jgi:hypothetical protein